MPRALTETEREAIRARLVEAGRELFARYGLRKTTVEELARAAGIAKGTFYLFFASKEDLYVELLLQELPRLVQRLLERSFHSTADVNEALVLFQRELVTLIEEDDLVRAVVMDLQEYTSPLTGHLDVHEVPTMAMSALAPLVAEIQGAQRRREIIDGDVLEILGVLGMIKALPFSKRQIDPQLYPRLVTRMSQVIADGLTCPARRAG
ncbi:TetR/AcrR family transcriptional regulator [Candidatus Bipolaricaulota bacterium]|nr:TetR/AcrR family transcriptional regulator [Candidatus Bipolaricaulota bacterium]